LPLKEYKPLFVIGVLISVLILSVAVISAFWPRYEERFFELGLLGKDQKAEAYYPDNNSTLQLDSSVLWHIYLHNHMGSPQNVSVRVKLLNSTMQAPDDREHEPSPFSYFMEIPVSLSIDETLLIPFSWSVVEATSQEGNVTINRLRVDNQTFNMSVLSSNRFRMVFELWVYDKSSQQYRFGWDSGKEFYSASLYMWFSLIVPS
jgi:uncharacterized membrane protein